MKKFIFLFILGIVTVSLQAQKKSGSVYSEHEDINKTRAAWAAFINGDEETFRSFYADTVHMFVNGQYSKRSNKSLTNILDWWSNVSNKKAVDDKGTYPDAIEYNDGSVWVQDWLRVTGIHDETGININVQAHNLYLFDENDKIVSHHQYFDDSFFEEIANSQTTRENGKVYINHPYIVTVRKLVNAYCAMDLDAITEFLAPNARFSSITMNMGESIGLDELMKIHEQTFAQMESIKMEQVGYPDCIYYDESDQYAVFSWWLETTIAKDGTKRQYPSMYVHTFNKDGKIIYGRYYVSSNHLE